MHKDTELIGGIQIQQFEGWTENSTYGRTRGQIDIKNYDHFLQLTHDFDSLFNTKTYIIHAPIFDVLTTLCKMDLPNDEIFPFNLSKKIDEHINTMFEDSKQFPIKKYIGNKKQFLIAYLNRIGVLISHIKQNIPLKYSMGVHHTINYTGIHPGGSRTIISGIYKKPVYFVVTDYTGRIRLDYKMFKFYDPHKMPFPVDNCSLHISKLWKNKNQPIIYEDIKKIKGMPIYEREMLKHHIYDGDVIYFKEVDESSFNYRSLNPSIQFMLKNEKFFINNECFLIKQKDGVWRINI